MEQNPYESPRAELERNNDPTGHDWARLLLAFMTLVFPVLATIFAAVASFLFATLIWSL